MAAAFLLTGCGAAHTDATDSMISSRSGAADTSWDQGETGAPAEQTDSGGKETSGEGGTAPEASKGEEAGEEESSGEGTAEPGASGDESAKETGEDADGKDSGKEQTGAETSEAALSSVEESSAEASSIEAVIGTLSEATGYSWSDVYIVILNTVLTKPDAHTGTPSFALLPWNDREEPVLIAGYWQDPAQEEYTMYSFSGDTLIEVEHFRGSLSVSPDERRILCVGPDGARSMYQYGEDHLVRLKAGTYEEEGLEPLAFTSLTEATVTDENIRTYIQ